jgi:hypothetical protein
MICPKCGGDIPESSFFCSACGCRVRKRLSGDRALEDMIEHLKCGDRRSAAYVYAEAVGPVGDEELGSLAFVCDRPDQIIHKSDREREAFDLLATEFRSSPNDADDWVNSGRLSRALGEIGSPERISTLEQLVTTFHGSHRIALAWLLDSDGRHGIREAMASKHLAEVRQAFELWERNPKSNAGFAQTTVAFELTRAQWLLALDPRIESALARYGLLISRVESQDGDRDSISDSGGSMTDSTAVEDGIRRQRLPWFIWAALLLMAMFFARLYFPEQTPTESTGDNSLLQNSNGGDPTTRELDMEVDREISMKLAEFRDLISSAEDRAAEFKRMERSQDPRAPQRKAQLGRELAELHGAARDIARALVGYPLPNPNVPKVAREEVIASMKRLGWVF